MFFLCGISYLGFENDPDKPSCFMTRSQALRGKSLAVVSLSAMGLLMLAVVVIGILLAHRTRFGNQVYAIGGNVTSANLMISTRSTTIRIYMLSTGLATLAGIVLSDLYPGRICTGGRRCGTGCYRLRVVIGGTLLSGGVWNGIRDAFWRGRFRLT